MEYIEKLRNFFEKTPHEEIVLLWVKMIYPTPTKSEEFIIRYLSGFMDQFVSPTSIGIAYGEHIGKSDKFGYHSAWASPKCKKLVDKKVLERNEKGWYKLVMNPDVEYNSIFENDDVIGYKKH